MTTEGRDLVARALAVASLIAGALALLAAVLLGGAP